MTLEQIKVAVQFGVPVEQGNGFDGQAFGEEVERVLELARQNGDLNVAGMPEGVSWVSFVGVDDQGLEPLKE